MERAGSTDLVVLVGEDQDGELALRLGLLPVREDRVLDLRLQRHGQRLLPAVPALPSERIINPKPTRRREHEHER